jgi:hypothetical protein
VRYGGRWLSTDVRIGARLLLKDRWFTLSAVFTLALGIAATNTVFTVVNAVLLRPLPFAAADRLVDLGEVSGSAAVCDSNGGRAPGFRALGPTVHGLAFFGLCGPGAGPGHRRTVAVTAYAAVQRTREIGVRMALGAQARDVWWAITSRGVRQVAVGLSLGIAGGLAVSRILPAQLSGASGSDPLTFAAVAGLLVTVALIATSLPARSAVKLDPMAALRSQ